MTKTPVPRFDLLDMHQYLFGSIQFSRGCPFQCEFCDIIVTFGRRPRLKTSDQIICELQGLRQLGIEIAFIVDDNLIGNKVAIKSVLRDIAAWQWAERFPFTFFTEASLDLAEDAELMSLMVDANISSVFVGIESPNEAALCETKKFQNVRKEGSLAQRVHRIQNAGLDVWCGMILGFDHDDASIFDAQQQFIREARVLHVMLGMLYAIPKTPLYERLQSEGRLDEADDADFGTNVIPLQLTRAELRDGYVRLLADLYKPNAYFDRLDELFVRGPFRFSQTRAAFWRRHPWSGLKGNAIHLVRSAALYRRLMRGVDDAPLRHEYRRRLAKLIRARPDPIVVFVYLIKCAMHYHHYRLSREMAGRTMKVVNTF